MGIFDKAKDLIGEHNDKVDQGIDKAADFIDNKTGGSHGADIDKGADALKDRLDGLRSDAPAETPANEPPAAPPVS